MSSKDYWIRLSERMRILGHAHRGTNHPNWRGRGNAMQGLLWPEQRARALNRDSHTCQRCGANRERFGREVDVHHIRPFRESRDNSPENLICFCADCHQHYERHPEDCPEPRKHWLLTAAVGGEQ